MDQTQTQNMSEIFTTAPELTYSITGDKKNFIVKIKKDKDSDEITYNSADTGNIKGNILNVDSINNAIEKINTQLNNPPTGGPPTGGKRSTSKSRKTQLRDEHGRFLPSNKRKNGRQRRTARRPMSDKTENTMLMASLV